MSPPGMNLPIRNVRFHGESWRVSGRATEIAKATFMTHLGHRPSGTRTVLAPPNWGVRRVGNSHLHSEQFRSPHKTRLPPCDRLNVQ
jgi:hypothetical protein